MDQFDIPIFKKLYELYREFYAALKRFPKSDRYAIGQTCQTTIAEVMEHVIRASRLPRQEKVAPLDHASTKLDILRVYIRVAKDTRALDVDTYVALQERIDEIGRMLGGWKRSSSNTTPS